MTRARPAGRCRRVTTAAAGWSSGRHRQAAADQRDAAPPRPRRPSAAPVGPGPRRPPAAASPAPCRGRRRPRAGRRPRRTRPRRRRPAPAPRAATAPASRPAPSADTSARLQRAAARRRPGRDIAGNATTTTNWGRNSTALVRISPPGVQAGLVLVEHVPRDDDVDVGEREERQQRVRVVQRLAEDHAGRTWRSARLPGRGARAAAPASRPRAGRSRRSRRRHRADSVGCQHHERGAEHQPRHAGGEVEQPEGATQRRSPWRMPAWPPMIVSGTP